MTEDRAQDRQAEPGSRRRQIIGIAHVVLGGPGILVADSTKATTRSDEGDHPSERTDEPRLTVG
jgi:hypothetical protein